MGGTPHPQTQQDRDYLRALFPYFRNLPADFRFPLEVQHDPPYIPPRNTFYCIVTAIVLCSVTTVIVVMRLWIRTRRGFGTDDWLMSASFFFYCCFNVVNTYSLFGTGLGFHLTDTSIQDVHNYLIILYLYILFLWFTINLTRCSILHLFLRLSHLQSPGQVKYIKVILVISYIFAPITVLSCLLECGLPISNLFELRAYVDGTCVAPRSMAFYGPFVAVNITLDALTFFPPILILFKIPLAPRKKFNLIFLLFLGVLTMVVGAARIFVFYQWMLDSYDITWNATAIALGGIIECSVANIIASLPALNQTFISYYHKVTRHGSGARRQGSQMRTLSLGAITSLFERAYVFNQQQTKASKYSSNATTLGNTEGQTVTSTTIGPKDKDSQAIHEGITALEPALASRDGGESDESLPDQLHTFQNYFIGNARISDEEMQMAEATDEFSTVEMPRRAKVQFANMRRPSSPTISGAAHLHMAE
ncbi:hypothetical protein AA313_de0200075 [Arthrobotrys entomopaga]|nr:hypothetical protein AA313_de0200075 [Arthrobotrys entomopaga]